MMDYNNLILDSIKVSDVDSWCDMHPTKYYDGNNREEGERALFYKMITDALIYKTRTVDNLTEVVLHLAQRVRALEGKH